MDQQILEGRPGRYWHRLDDGRIQCDLCPRYCKLHEGQRGLCFVRGRQDDQIVLTTYGRSSGFCIDPIEKKPLNHFLPGTSVLSFGTAGCNLTCKFCQNWDISKARELDRLQDVASPRAIAEAAVRSDCRSVAFTYNDLVIFLEYAVDVAQACRERDIKTVAVSAGYICAEPRLEFFRHMDAANIDLKGFTEGLDVWFEITTLLIPGENDSAAEISALCHWVIERLGPDVPLHFSAFHPDWKMLETPPTPPATLCMARRIGKEVGLRHVYTGNVHDPEGQSTYCHGCEALLIGRDWYELTAWHLTTEGRCQRCGTPCAGVFEETHGRWGQRRQRVTVRPLPAHAVAPR